MPKEYQSEKSPIFDSQKSPKTLRKLHIMSQLYAAKVCQLFCNTRYAHVPLFLYCTPAPVHVQVAPADALQPPRVRLQPQEAEDPRDLRHAAAQHSLE